MHYYLLIAMANLKGNGSVEITVFEAHWGTILNFKFKKNNDNQNQ